MAYFIRGTGDPRTPLQHQREIFKEYILSCFFKELVGKRGSGKPIIIDEAQFGGRGAGDTARFHFVPQVYGEGIEGQNASITGNEDVIEEFSMDIRVDQIAKAFKSKGKVTKLRTIIPLRDEFKTQLSNWFRWRTELDMVSALTGYTTDGVTKLEGAARDSTPLVVGEGRCFRPDYASSKFTTVEVSEANSTNAALLSAFAAGDIMNTEILDNLQNLAKTAGKYPMKPIRLKDGNEYYMLVLHPKAAVQLRQDARWEKRALATYNGAKTLESDPIATGAMGVWEKIIVKEADHISTATNGTLTIARNLLLGADAALMAYAQTLDYNEDMHDYKRIFGVAADEIRGFKKLQFDGVDLNIAQVPCVI